jgi:UDP-N-acetyl-D-glucosamine dehydrogenase
MKLVQRFEDRSGVIGIIGLGYVGLPLAEVLSSAGFKTVGFDIDTTKVEMLLEGRTYIRHIPDATVRRMGENGFEPTTDFSRAGECDAILICVPTPLTHHWEPDMRFVVSSCEALLPTLRKDQIVVLESTTWPGTTVELMKPILERSGLKAGEDFFLAYSPEREDPNNPDFGTKSIPKVVGADSEEALAAVTALYSAFIDKVVPVRSTRVAEACKILENTYRSVNIALVNELKIIFERMGIDVWEVIDAAATKPFGFHRFNPGPGIGGHCIPVDPFYLTWKAKEYELVTRFIETAGEVNRAMPQYVVDRTQRAISDRGKGMRGARILMLGLAYKKNVDDARESPSWRLIELLEERGAEVDYHDPFIPMIPKSREHGHLQGRHSVPIEDAGEYDAVLIATEHDGIDYEALKSAAKLIIDTRGVYRGDAPNIVKA